MLIFEGRAGRWADWPSTPLKSSLKKIKTLKGKDWVAWSRVLAPSGRGGKFTQPSFCLLSKYRPFSAFYDCFCWVVAWSRVARLYFIVHTHWTQDIPAAQHPVASQAHRLPRHLWPAVQRHLAEDELPSRYVSRGCHDPFHKINRNIT